ncbi:MAG: hypothetical protein PHY99_11190, partial [Bacteroidales bacterium]|nr:hypothetical protein [Bacteroidales bacterium]
LLSFLGICLFAPIGFAGGIVTNTNQSVGWVRSLVRDASLGVDAVYYNPAGTARMANGFYFELNNQSVFQTKTVTNQFPYLNNKEFVGDVKVPLFPTANVVYKKGDLSIFGGFAVVGGGGSADYATGLPSFEIPISRIPASLVASGIPTTGYDADIYFTGSSSYMGITVGAAYKINDFIAVGLGLRYIMAKNTYSGYIKNIMINPTYPAFGSEYNGSMVLAKDFFTDGATLLNTMSAGSTQMAAGFGQIVAAGGGAIALSNGKAVGLTDQQIAQAQQLIGAAGMDPSTMTIQQAQAVLNAVAPVFLAKANAMTTNATATSDIEVDAEQTGNSFTPIISVDLSLLDGDLGIAMKYEHKTPLEVKNATVIDGSGLFPQGAVTPAEMPSLFTLGIRYKINEKLRTQIGAHYFVDRSAKYGKKDASLSTPTNPVYVTNGETVLRTDGTTGAYLTGNGYELGIGFEYDLNKALTLSAGYLFADSKPSDVYQTDMSYTLMSNSLGFGGVVHIKDRLDLSLGITGTFFADFDKTVNYTNPADPSKMLAVNELYEKTTTILSVGLGYRFGK